MWLKVFWVQMVIMCLFLQTEIHTLNFWLKAVLSNLFFTLSAADKIAVIKAAGRSSKLKSDDQNNLLHVINYVVNLESCLFKP